MRRFSYALLLTVLLGEQYFDTANAIPLRLSGYIDEAELIEVDAQTLNEIEMASIDFKWTNSHDCTWVHRRLRDTRYPSYDDQLASLLEAKEKWVDESMPLSDAISWPDVLTSSGGSLASYANSKYLKWVRISEFFPAS